VVRLNDDNFANGASVMLLPLKRRAVLMARDVLRTALPSHTLCPIPTSTRWAFLA
jgi:hypothetical protein